MHLHVLHLLKSVRSKKDSISFRKVRKSVKFLESACGSEACSWELQISCARRPPDGASFEIGPDVAAFFVDSTGRLKSNNATFRTRGAANSKFGTPVHLVELSLLAKFGRDWRSGRASAGGQSSILGRFRGSFAGQRRQIQSPNFFSLFPCPSPRKYQKLRNVPLRGASSVARQGGHAK